MNDYKRLQLQLRDRPYLIADGASGRVWLANEASTLRAMLGGGEFPSAVILNAGEALKRFVRTTGLGKDSCEFGLKDIVAIAGLSYMVMYQYIDKGVFAPSIRNFGGPGRGKGIARFSYADAFCAGIIGALRRHGLRLDVLKNVQPLFTEKPRKRTARQRLTATRS